MESVKVPKIYWPLLTFKEHLLYLQGTLQATFMEPVKVLNIYWFLQTFKEHLLYL